MPTLYHYTNAAGLKGIIDSRSFWATEYRFLNDSSEFQYGWEKLSQELRASKNEILQVSKDAWATVEAHLDNIDHSGVIAFVGSLSEEGDVLSQWRGYNGGKGFAVGIDAETLNLNAMAQGFSLFPVRYLESEQKDSTRGAVEMLCSLLFKQMDQNLYPETIRLWLTHALTVALALKDAHFKEEREYRLALVKRSWPSIIQTRPTPRGLVPYVACHFDRVPPSNSLFHPQNRGIEKIIVGPALRGEQRAAVDALLASNHMRLLIEKSKIPYVAD